MVKSSKPSSTMAKVYVMGLPFSSLTVTWKSVSGLSVAGMSICGRKMVCGSSTNTGITPYMRMGKSFVVWAWGCSRLMCRYTFGAISGVILNEYLASFPLSISIHSRCSMPEPFSMLTSARPPAAAGIMAVAVSPGA